MPEGHPPISVSDQLVDQLPCGVVQTEPDFTISAVSHQVAQWLGCGHPDFTDLYPTLPDLLPVEDRQRFQDKQLSRLLATGSMRDVALNLSGAFGKVVPTLIHGTMTSAGCLFVLVPFDPVRHHDRQLRAAEKRAEAADRARSNFLSIISHEIRTPLHAILEAGNFLMKEAPRPDQLPLINALRSAGNNLLLFLNDVLDVSKLEAGELELERRPFHVVELINEITTIYGPQCREKGLYLNTVVPPAKLPTVSGDCAKLLQVLHNLVSNALKFCPTGGISIVIDYVGRKADGHKFGISVHDTGIGIAEDQLENIFRPFVQARRETLYQFGGTGLGLAICQRILEAAGSRLKVESTEGVGTTFSFTIVLPEADVELFAEVRTDYATSPRVLPPLNHLRVANVDDNRTNLLINARYFQEWKLPYDQFRTGRELLGALEDKRYDVILTDLRMPDLTGYELAKIIRKHEDPEVRDVAIIALSASAASSLNARMQHAGIDALVGKPFDPGHLHRLLLQFGDRSQTADNDKDPYDDRFTEVEDIFGSVDKAEHQEFLRLVLNDFAHIRSELQAYLEDQSVERYRAIRHDTLTTTRLFKLTEIDGLLNQGLEQLLAGNQEVLNASIPVIIGLIAAFEKIVASRIVKS